jgi:hypothetical protein
MSTSYECPACHRALTAPVDVAAKSVKCPGCGTVFTAPALEAAPVDDRFAITEQKPARPVSLLPPEENEKDFGNLYVRHNVPPWADKELPDTGVLPGRTRAVLAIACLAGCAMWAVIDLGTSALHYRLLERAEQGEVIPKAEEDTMEVLEFVAVVTRLPLMLATAVAFCLWFYRAYKNLAFLRTPKLNYTPGWAAGAFFVPILQLFRPYQIAQETWQASDPDILTPFWWRAGRSWIIRCWWTFWIIGNILANISTRLTWAATTAPQIQAALALDMLSDIPEILAAGFVIGMILKIQQRQALKLQRLHEEPHAEEEDKPY